MTAAALATFNSARLDAQTALFAKPVRINGTVNDPVRTGAFNAPRFASKPEEGGQAFDHDCTLRLRKSEWPEFTSALHFKDAKLEVQLDGAWFAFSVANITNVHLAGEWKLSLNARI